MKYYLYAAALFLPLGLSAAEIQESFPVSTYINKSALYPYLLTITPEPAHLILAFNKETRAFTSKSTRLMVSTDIPQGELALGFGYNLRLLTNTSECRNSLDDVLTQKGFIYLLVDGRSFTESDPVLNQPLKTINSDNNLSGENTLTLQSETITNIMQICKGSILIEAELAL